jgi:hypothetical protein
MWQRFCRSALTTARHASSFAQSASDMVGGFCFSATMCGFFIIPMAFFGGMVVTHNGSGRRWEDGEYAGEGEGGGAAAHDITVRQQENEG